MGFMGIACMCVSLLGVGVILTPTECGHAAPLGLLPCTPEKV